MNPPPPVTRRTFENTVEKGENAGNQHFLLFPSCFLFPLPPPPKKKKFSIFNPYLIIIYKCFEFGLVQNFVVW